MLKAIFRAAQFKRDFNLHAVGKDALLLVAGELNPAEHIMACKFASDLETSQVRP